MAIHQQQRSVTLENDAPRSESTTKKSSARRRGNREGAIYQTADGRWRAAVLQPNGKRKYLSGRRRQDVSAKLTAAQADLAKGLPLPSARLTLAAYLDRWLESARPTVRVQTFAGYESIIRLHVKPDEIAQRPIVQLSPQDLDILYARLLAKGLSKRTVQLTHAILGRALRQAERQGDIARNPARLANPPRPARHEIKPLSPGEIRELLEAARGDRYEALYVLAVTTGLRSGELLGLRWTDIDSSGDSVHVRQQAQRVPRRLLREGDDPWTFPEPKTGAGRRTVTLPAVALLALKVHRDRQVFERSKLGSAWAELDLVFANEVGRPVERQNLARRSFAPLLARADMLRSDRLGRPLTTGERFPHIRFHDLRHSAATLLLAEGVHPKVVQERLGHATIAVTMDTYSHVLPSMQAEAAAKLDRFFGAEPMDSTAATIAANPWHDDFVPPAAIPELA